MEKFRSEVLNREQPESLMMPDWRERLKEDPIELIEEKAKFTIQELKEKYSGKVAALDLYISDIENQGHMEDGVFRIDGVINIDHHAPVDEFSKYISSTNLAIEWVKKNGPLDKNYPIVINHADCDSILSSLIIRGILPPDEKFGEAAIAADHLGKENEIADLLQAIQDERDLEFSVRNLELLLGGKELEEKAKELLKNRYADRRKVREIVEKGEISSLGGVSYAQLDKKVESNLFPAEIPDAQVILLFSPHKDNPGHWEVKVRLGMVAPAGLTLNKLRINDLDPNFNGRWNAGSNKRAGGTSLGIEEYAKFLNERLQEYLEDKKQ